MGLGTLMTISCALQQLPGPPSVYFENGTFLLLPIDKRLCPDINPLRDSIIELYTSDNLNEPQILLPNNMTSIISSNFDFDRNTVIYFHGFLESPKSDATVQMKNYYLKYLDVNFIIVNNERLLAGPSYATAARNVLPIGKYIGKFIDNLVKIGLNLSMIHIIGMSLGGQIAGITGKYIQSGKAKRITGLDPAGPLFDILPETERIAATDAVFVDIVHTNSGIFGTKYNSGTIDIWVNGGTFQPGCKLGDILQRRRGSLSELIFCHHYQSYRMYIMSLVNPREYPVVKCDSYQKYSAGSCSRNNRTFLGVQINTSYKGNFYITTGIAAIDI